MPWQNFNDLNVEGDALVLPQYATEVPHHAQDAVPYHLRAQLREWLADNNSSPVWICFQVTAEFLVSYLDFGLVRPASSSVYTHYLERVLRFRNFIEELCLGALSIWRLVSRLNDAPQGGGAMTTFFMQAAPSHYAEETAMLSLRNFDDDDDTGDNTHRDNIPNGSNAELNRARKLVLRLIPCIFLWIAVFSAIKSACKIYYRLPGRDSQYTESVHGQAVIMSALRFFLIVARWALS